MFENVKQIMHLYWVVQKRVISRGLETENREIKRPKIVHREIRGIPRNPHLSTNETKRNFNKCFLFDFSKKWL